MAKNKSFTESQATALELFQELLQTSKLQLVEVMKAGKDAISYGVQGESGELLAIIPTQGKYETYELGAAQGGDSNEEE